VGAWPAIVAQTLAVLGAALRLRWGLLRTLVLIVRFALAFIVADAVLDRGVRTVLPIGALITGKDSLYVLAAAAGWFAVYYGVFALWLALRYQRPITVRSAGGGAGPRRAQPRPRRSSR
jgi:hypothetical protein